MSDINEIVWDATKSLNIEKAKEHAKVSRCNVNTLIIAYAVVAVVLFLQLQGISVLMVALTAVLGLSLIGLSSWLQGRKIYKVIYQQELQRLENLVQLTQQKQKNSRHIVGAIQALAAIVDAKDPYTHGHSAKVATYATEIAEKLGCSRDSIETIRVAALLHDIGKIGVSDQLLSKPGLLSLREWKELRRHPELGVTILQHIEALKDCLPTVLHHHERYDGSGYPGGLKGDDIPFAARILAVADAYDAMTSTRPYRRNKMAPEQALAELVCCTNQQFDPRVVGAFVSLSEESQQAASISDRIAVATIDRAAAASTC